MDFSYLKQCSNKLLLKNVLLPIVRGSQLRSFFLLIFRFLTFNFFFNLKHSNKDLIYSINQNSDTFILDLREAVIDLHNLAKLTQFFRYLGKKYKIFEIWIDNNSFRYNQYKNFLKEFSDILAYLSKIINCNVLRKNKNDKYNADTSYLRISKTKGYKINGKPFGVPENIHDFFIKKLGFESKPIDFSFNSNLSKNADREEIKILKQTLKENFIIIFYPTYDPFLRYEKKERKLGVINQENFKFMKEVYEEILSTIKTNKLKKIKIVLFNKKSLNWKTDDNFIDLRHFEDLNLNFPEIFGIFNDTCNWTIGSEGTISYFLVMCSNLKHVLFIDNSHWKNCINSNNVVPLFYSKRDDVEYNNKPVQYIPKSKKNIINNILKDYNNFINGEKSKYNLP